MDVKQLEHELSLWREELKHHKLYEVLTTVEDIKTFMQEHVFAVWDFMSLLKSLQRNLTNTSTPWMPVANPEIARFINEIVLDEESDVNELGEPMSHFEMYLDAMRQIGAETKAIELFLDDVKQKQDITEALHKVEINQQTIEFVKYTFSVIESNESHKIAAAFTFGREDVIPDMFFQIINHSKSKEKSFSKLTYYLNRHIELDGDEHGPLALRMIVALCGSDARKWEEVLEVSKLALQHRIALWDGIYNSIIKHKAIGEVK
ncbi:DUF3050 domain-containing protein [Winogradskyella aquimaris]|uniref:DUF3050 domain-containing protein n=1 Tax=Winogradskyella aquimaris TaxID=864074 RepID=A0ABU5EQN9_9FLAO|nr:DUF3050 domain-containing protein [Winogradskyella aquimaris]MDY2586997.1 DUF3050 domain-containing protein [Winogradskyella aquimaris]